VSDKVCNAIPHTTALFFPGVSLAVPYAFAESHLIELTSLTISLFYQNSGVILVIHTPFFVFLYWYLKFPAL